MAFIAYRIIAEVPDDMSFEDREAMDDKILAALGCDGTEPAEQHPIRHFASTGVDTMQAAYTWLN